MNESQIQAHLIASRTLLIALSRIIGPDAVLPLYRQYADLTNEQLLQASISEDLLRQIQNAHQELDQVIASLPRQ